DDGAGEDEAALASPKFDIHRLLEDSDILGGPALTAAEVQALLAGYGSYLATYRDPAFANATAASIIVSEGKAAGISPLYLLARIQIESSLIQSKSSRNLAQATGCGCPDGGSCSKSYAGFGMQVRCSAQKMAKYISDLDTRGYTIADWAVGKSRKTLDPCTITPQNRATAALYTYTPWVGANGKQCGRASVGGSSAVSRVLALYKNNPALAGATPGAPATPAPVTCASATLGRAVPAGTCVQARSDRAWYQCGADASWDAAPTAPTDGSGPSGTCTAAYAL
ncbi:MAG TPA: hypothetical protein VMZ28_17825, partial [Kofleriaceae bacterium]|nr:hypothetical protein [Kofleriaceae bacterium]